MMGDFDKYEIQASCCSPLLYPTDVIFGLLWFDEDKSISIPKKIPFGSSWGEPETNIISLDDEIPIPKKLNLLWISGVENKCYEFNCDLPIMKIHNLFNQQSSLDEQLYTHIIIGIAPLGKIAIWVWGIEKSTLLFIERGSEVQLQLKKIYPTSKFNSIKEYCEYLINKVKIGKGINYIDLLDEYNFNLIMKQYLYRYVLNFSRWDNGMFKADVDDKISRKIVLYDKCLDGTHDKTGLEEIFCYHKSGTPDKIRLKWEHLKNEYELYIWFENGLSIKLFERFYGAHPETKVDFIIRIDAEKKKYELALFRQGLKEPVVIPESAYQLIVFKNKFEDYRSENYNQPRGAWIW